LIRDSVSYRELKTVLEKSYRNGNWRRLNRFERALYRASLELARLRGRIVNESLLSLLRVIIRRLLKRFSDTALELGRRKAGELRKLYEGNGVFTHYPSLRRLLWERNYLLWLGSRELVLRGLGIIQNH